MQVNYLDEEHQRAFQNHINLLFGYSKPNEIYVDLERLPEISNISDTLVNGATVEIRDLKEYFEKCPNQNSARVKPKIIGDLQEMTSSFGVENIFFDDSNEFSALILQKFTGRHLVMPRASLKTRDIVEFVRKWISNEAYQNLETVVIGMYDETSEVRRREAEGNLPLIGYDPLVRPPKYNYDPK